MRVSHEGISLSDFILTPTLKMIVNDDPQTNRKSQSFVLLLQTQQGQDGDLIPPFAKVIDAKKSSSSMEDRSVVRVP